MRKVDIGKGIQNIKVATNFHY